MSESARTVSRAWGAWLIISGGRASCFGFGSGLMGIVQGLTLAFLMNSKRNGLLEEIITVGPLWLSTSTAGFPVWCLRGQSELLLQAVTPVCDLVALQEGAKGKANLLLGGKVTQNVFPDPIHLLPTSGFKGMMGFLMGVDAKSTKESRQVGEVGSRCPESDDQIPIHGKREGFINMGIHFAPDGPTPE